MAHFFLIKPVFNQVNRYYHGFTHRKNVFLLNVTFKRGHQRRIAEFSEPFGGGKAHLKLTKSPVVSVEAAAEEGVEAVPIPEEPQKDPELMAGVEIGLSLPKKKITSLDMLSGGEKSLVSLAALFALISVSPPPFLVLDEIDTPLDEDNAARFAGLVTEFAKKTQFIIVTHNRATMEAADVLYGVTMEDDGVSKVLSLKLEG